jgi:hypothetical protein
VIFSNEKSPFSYPVAVSKTLPVVPNSSMQDALESATGIGTGKSRRDEILVENTPNLFF